MTEKELLKQLKNLRELGAGAGWSANNRQVLKQQIFNGQEEETGFTWLRKINLVMSRVLQPAAVALFIFVFLLAGSLWGWNSGNAQPGNSLYIAKRLSEKTRMTMALSEQAKAKLNLEFAVARNQELGQLLGKNDQQAVQDLKNNVKQEISQAKERLAKINQPVELTEEPTGEEVQFFSAGVGKSDERLDIALPETCPTDSQDCPSQQAQTVEKTAQVLAEAQQLVADGKYQEAADQLDQAEAIINQTE